MRNKEKIWDFVISLLIIALFGVIGLGVIKDNKLYAENHKIAEAINTKDSNIRGNLPSITCWGDSLTAGVGGNGVTYTGELRKLIKLDVYNMGVGGEDTITIACRQGARQMMVNNITIPSNSEKVEIGRYNKFFDNYNKVINPLRQGSAGINNCFIEGVEGKLLVEQTDSVSDDAVFYFERLEKGKEVQINKPTPIITNGSINRKNDITIIFIGQNGGYTDIDDLVAQQKSMISYTGHDKYIILGLTSGTSEQREELENRMIREYGDKYINLRKYLSEDGIKDAGLNPTEKDIEEMNQGIVPESLRSDTIHGNSYYYELVGKKLYNKIIELNYLNDDQKEYLHLNS